MLERTRPLKPSTIYLSTLIGGLGLLVLHTTLGFGGKSLNGPINDGVYNALMLGSAAAVLARGVLVRGEDRLAWLVMGAGLLSWSVGELYYSFLIEGTSAEAGGSITPADGFYLAMYPCFYVAVGMLARRHLRNARAGMWLDGVIAGLGAASVAAALILPPILDHATNAHSSVIVSMAYPIGDLLLTAFALGAIGVTGWRPGGVWLLIAAGMLISAIADSAYLYQTSTGSFQAGTWLECLWPLAAILLALAAWTPQRRVAARSMQSWQMLSVPTLALVSALAVLVYGNLGHHLTLTAVILAAATVLAAGAHMVVTWRENLALLVRSQRQSLTDSLTGLGNRRRLMGDLHLACRSAGEREPWGVALYDLDGFKLFNDTFGHPAGDSLLIRLAERLSCAVEPVGTAYRMGGDEFCVLFDRSHDGHEALIRASVLALAEDGHDFSITASHGVVHIPEEMSDPAAILQLADQRLYRRKAELAALRSVDAYESEDDLALGQYDGDALAGAAAEQRASDRRIRR
ncbi:MAG TPA: GGDEF domain-containing protein [Solirubrobacteraceae bacterium]|jgi:diguanylate cyclase (GGDEF)-like protein|nr:GGDEF domain-containing protein [Solirubrobacteraceae bacterium]